MIWWLVCPSISYFSKTYYCKVYLFIRPQRNTTTITTLRTITFTLTLAPRRTARETIPTDLTTLFSPTVAVKLSNTTSMATPVTSLTSLTRVRPSMPTITNQRNITLTWRTSMLPLLTATRLPWNTKMPTQQQHTKCENYLRNNEYSYIALNLRSNLLIIYYISLMMSPYI